CFICKESGATITCRETRCGLSFHLPCATRGRCITQYFGLYRSFCSEHSPVQEVEAAPEKGTTCLLCIDPVDDQRCYRTMVCPVCRHAWFHRDCIQAQALSAGFHSFRCPLCRDADEFLLEMFTMGIRIPFRLVRPTWENTDEFEAIGERHSRCDASECLCPGGREQDDEEGPWQLFVCSSCAAEGTHRRCSHLSPRADSWECAGC
ncbi:PHF7 protein, partial [Todus mexicanus]|nr:PHF7 protein [Todus mexicanus]